MKTGSIILLDKRNPGNNESRKFSLTDDGIEGLANESRESLDKLLSGLGSLLLLTMPLGEILEVSF